MEVNLFHFKGSNLLMAEIFFERFLEQYLICMFKYINHVYLSFLLCENTFRDVVFIFSTVFDSGVHLSWNTWGKVELLIESQLWDVGAFMIWILQACPSAHPKFFDFRYKYGFLLIQDFFTIAIGSGLTLPPTLVFNFALCLCSAFCKVEEEGVGLFETFGNLVNNIPSIEIQFFVITCIL